METHNLLQSKNTTGSTKTPKVKGFGNFVNSNDKAPVKKGKRKIAKKVPVGTRNLG